MQGQPAHPGLSDRSSPWPVVAAVLVGCWTVAVTVGTQTGGWLTDQVLLGFGRDRLGWLWPVLGLATVVLVGTPALLLAVLPRSAAVRATGRAWLIGALALGVLTLLRVVPPVHHEAYLAGLAGAAALSALAVRWSMRRSSGSNAGTPPDATASSRPATRTRVGSRRRHRIDSRPRHHVDSRRIGSRRRHRIGSRPRHRIGSFRRHRWCGSER